MHEGKRIFPANLTIVDANVLMKNAWLVYESGSLYAFTLQTGTQLISDPHIWPVIEVIDSRHLMVETDAGPAEASIEAGKGCGCSDPRKTKSTLGQMQALLVSQARKEVRATDRAKARKAASVTAQKKREARQKVRAARVKEVRAKRKK